jgi:hypothetical protein
MVNYRSTGVRTMEPMPSTPNPQPQNPLVLDDAAALLHTASENPR